MLAVCMCPDAHVLMVVVCVVCMNPPGRAIDADQGARICCVCAAKYRKWAEPCRLPGNPHMPLVAPRACGAVRNVADCKGAVADYKPNMAKFGPGTAGRMCHSPIGNCQVLCAASAHAGGAGGGVAYLL